MITQVKFNNFGPIPKLEWNNIGKINLLIGANASGKTFLLKMLYSIIRASEEFRRGNEPKKFDEILSEKIYWTFQVEKFSDLITKSVKEKLRVELSTDYGDCNFSFGDRTVRNIIDCKSNFEKRSINSIFLPAKEILSMIDVVQKSRDEMRIFGFDDTYYDLAKVLSIQTQKGRNYPQFADSRNKLEEIIHGTINYDQESGWTFRKGRYVYPINIVSEGIKKISIIDILLGNRYITPSSIMFIDEPDSGLHPDALSQFLDIIYLLSKRDIQVFIASHSYFTIKKLLLIAKKESISIPTLFLNENEIIIEDLKNGMPDNSIIEESVILYKEEVGLALK